MGVWYILLHALLILKLYLQQNCLLFSLAD